eukprot:SAG22_NODE_6387_length_863_cov_0.941099_2_plen_85_part_00
MWEDHRGHWHVLYHRMFDGEGKLDPNWGKADGSWKHSRPIPSPGFAGGKGSDHCLSFCFSAFPCGSTALTEDSCNQGTPLAGTG